MTKSEPVVREYSILCAERRVMYDGRVGLTIQRGHSKHAALDLVESPLDDFHAMIGKIFPTRKPRF